MVMRLGTWLFGGRAMYFQAELYLGLAVFIGYILVDTQVLHGCSNPSHRSTGCCQQTQGVARELPRFFAKVPKPGSWSPCGVMTPWDTVSRQQLMVHLRAWACCSAVGRWAM